MSGSCNATSFDLIMINYSVFVFSSTPLPCVSVCIFVCPDWCPQSSSVLKIKGMQISYEAYYMCMLSVDCDFLAAAKENRPYSVLYVLPP